MHTDIGIVIALTEEFRELYQKSGFKTWTHPVSRVDYFETEILAESGEEFRCKVCVIGAMSPTAAASATTQFLNDCNPRNIFCLGIAGTMAEEVRLCDLVLATTVENYLENSKAIARPGRKEEFQFSLSGDTYRTSSCIESRLKKMEFSHPTYFAAWRDDYNSQICREISPEQITRLREKALLSDLPSIHFGHVATGSSVSQSTAFKNWLLKGHDRKYTAIEMESSAVLHAVHQKGLSDRAMVIRGISDLGDETKKDLDGLKNGVLRKLAMNGLLDFLLVAIRSGALLECLSTDKTGTRPTDAPSDLIEFVVVEDQSPQNAITNVIDALSDKFGFRWEECSFTFSESPAVFWPVRLRAPTPIHAVQAFAAAALQKAGAEVFLYIDDLGRVDYRVHSFTEMVSRWFVKVGAEANKLRTRTFTDTMAEVGFDGWAHAKRWFGESQVDLINVLEISKLLPPDQRELPMSTMQRQKPRRLLTPVMVWSTMESMRSNEPSRPIITLGGYDELNLWNAYRRSILPTGAKVGHLYNSQLDRLARGESFPMHMGSEQTFLAWTSQEDISTAIASELTGSSNQWQFPNRLIPWCLSGCVALPQWVASQGAQVLKIVYPKNPPMTQIRALAKQIDNWMLRQ